MNAHESTNDLEDELRSLAERAAPATQAPEFLATSALLTARARRRHRQVGLAVAAGVGLLASAAAVTVGGGPYFDVVQPSAAMAPSIDIGDSVTFNRDLTARRGDVVYLELTTDGHEVTMISRVIGQAGDTVACPATSNGTCEGVRVNGQPIRNAYLYKLATLSFPATKVPKEAIFVLGDNRNEANDSRLIGPVPIDAVAGVAVATQDDTGTEWAIPGAPHHDAPDDQNLIDPPLAPPPASTDQQ